MRALSAGLIAISLCALSRAAETPSPAIALFHQDASLLQPPHNEPSSIAPPKETNVRSILYDGKPYHGHATHVFAYLGIPPHSAGQRLPAMVLVHGGGGTAFSNWVKLWNDRGYAAIAMDTCGSVPVHNEGLKTWTRQDDGGPPGWDAAFDQVHDDLKDQWPYHAVADIVLANSLLRSLPDVDPDRIGLTGISWGGYLTCLTSAADNRFKFAVPVYGCGYLDECVWKPTLEKMSSNDREAWLNQWDPRHFIGSATMPMLWVDSTNDKNYPLGPLQRTYDLQQSPRTISINLRMKHAHAPGETPDVIRAYADSFLKNGPPLPEIKFRQQEGKSVSWTIAKKGSFAKAELIYTKDNGAWEIRLWETTSAELHDDSATADLPGAATAYYLQLADDHGANISSACSVTRATSP